jgi:hypothetical protein
MHNDAAQMYNIHSHAGHRRASVCAKFGKLFRIFTAPRLVQKNGSRGSANWLAIIHCGDRRAPDRALQISGVYSSIDIHFGPGRRDAGMDFLLATV